MIDDYGAEEFRKLVEARLGFALENLAEMPLPETKAITWVSTSRSRPASTTSASRFTWA